MTYWFRESSRRKIFQRKSQLLCMFDFDGTLSPIVQHAAEAVLPEVHRDQLKRLSARPRCRVGVASGRSLVDIKTRVGVRGLWYAGNHGYEISGPGSSYRWKLVPSERRRWVGIKRWVAQQLPKYPGAWIEDKGLTLSLHYRLLRTSDEPRFTRWVQEHLLPHLQQEQVNFYNGKKVWDVRPTAMWNKGEAVEWIQHQLKPKPYVLYVGDDQTDEDVFRKFGDTGATIRVGHSDRSHARYYLRSFHEINRLIEELLQP